MRTEKAFKNVITSLLLQIVVAISGIIIPRFFIELYGSPINGLVSSISQFITYMGLVEAGIGAAGTVSLFRPLSLGDKKSINEIVSATKKFYLQSGFIFVGLVLVLILVYPKIVNKEIPNVDFVRMMIFVLSVNGVVDFFILGKYRVLLTADQRGYVISIVQIVGVIIVTIVSIVLMEQNCSALLVKSVAAIVYVLRSIVIAIYAKQKYKWLNLNASPNVKAFNQRWAALLHQIVAMIVNNTDVVLLTLLLPNKALTEVSVYSVYNLVGYALSNAMSSIANGLSSGFGEVISRSEQDVLNKAYSSYEYLYYMIIFLAYSCMAVLLYPFISLYSQSFVDANEYTRWILVLLFTVVGVVQSLRMPGITLITAAGHYKQTKWRAITEASINLVVSIALIFRLGIVGVLIGTIASYLYRSIDVIVYASKNFISGTLRRTFSRIIRNAIVSVILIVLCINYITISITSWLEWFIMACLFGAVEITCLIIINWIFEPKEIKNLFYRIKNIISR